MGSNRGGWRGHVTLTKVWEERSLRFVFFCGKDLSSLRRFFEGGFRSFLSGSNARIGRLETGEWTWI